jgi:hypothetical protein
MQATWIRLDSGEWGVRVESNLEAIFQAIVGQEVDVTRRDGVVSSQKVTKVVKTLQPTPVRRVRGRVFPATGFVAICEVEPREKLPRAKSASSKRTREENLRTALRGGIPRAGTAARSTYNELRAELVQIEMAKKVGRPGSVNVDGVGFEPEETPSVEVTLADLLSKPSRLSPESTLTRA